MRRFIYFFASQIGFFDQYFWCQIQPTHNFHRQSLSVRPYYHLLIVDRTSSKKSSIYQSIEVQNPKCSLIWFHKNQTQILTYVVCNQRNWLKLWLKSSGKLLNFLFDIGKRYWNFNLILDCETVNAKLYLILFSDWKFHSYL